VHRVSTVLAALALVAGCDGGDRVESWHTAAAPVVAQASPAPTASAPPSPSAIASAGLVSLAASTPIGEPAPRGGGDPGPDGPPTAATAPWPVAGDLALSEIMARPADGMAGARAWLELVNLADSPRSLDGCELISGGGASIALSASDAAEPGAIVLIAAPGEVADGLPTPDAALDVELAFDLLGPLALRCGEAELLALPAALVDPGARAPGVALQRDADSPWAAPAADSEGAAAWCDALPTYGPGGRGTPGEPNLACDADVDWCRLMYPALVTATVGAPFLGRIEVLEPGLTDLKAPLPADFVCQLGLGPDGAAPDGPAFTWTSADADPAPPATVAPNRRSLVAHPVPAAPGIADLAARCTKTGGVTWLYCDLDGSQNGYAPAQAGHALILAP
jgi:hypothetical protein